MINFGGRCPRSALYKLTSYDPSLGYDQLFFDLCYCNYAWGGGNYPNYRPTKAMQQGWFTNVKWPNTFGYSPDSICRNADYTGDCAVDDADADIFCAATGGSTEICGNPRNPRYC